MKYLDELWDEEQHQSPPPQEENLSIPDSPSRMGFSNFPVWRKYQQETVGEIINSKKKVFMLDAPTGTGKTIIGMSAASRIPRAIYLCTTKMLQHQIEKDFHNIPILKGRSNYPCLFNDKVERLFPEITADDCPKKIEKHRESDEGAGCQGKCPYILAKKRALSSPISVLNTAYFMSEANFVGSFSDMDFVIIDEADELEDQLMKFVEIVITQKMLDRLQLSPPRYKTKFESWKEWAKDALPRVVNAMVELERTVEDPIIDRVTMRIVSSLKSLIWKMHMFIEVVDIHWVYIEQEEKWTFKPIWVSMFGKKYIFDHGKKFLLMSATILSPIRLAQNLGIDRGEWAYKAIPSQFPIKNRKVIYRPIANISQKTKEEELPKIIPAIEKIFNDHKKEKGLIHTVSYSNARYIMMNLHDKRLIIHDSKTKDDIFSKFKSSKSPLVMISPSMDRGVDLVYDLARFQIIVKTPFADISDKQIAARLFSGEYGKQWYYWMTACSLVQMSGRIVRAEDDSGVTYIIDEQFGRFFGQNTQLFPGWWKEALEVGE
jgi:ATP-dependent DNA helicase DinG